MMIESTQNLNIIEKSFKTNKENDIMEIDFILVKFVVKGVKNIKNKLTKIKR